MSMYEHQRQDLNDLCLAVIHEKHPNNLTELIGRTECPLGAH